MVPGTIAASDLLAARKNQMGTNTTIISFLNKGTTDPDFPGLPPSGMDFSTTAPAAEPAAEPAPSSGVEWVTLGTSGYVLSDGNVGSNAATGAGEKYIGMLLDTSTSLVDGVYLFTDGYNTTGYSNSARTAYTGNDISNDIVIYFNTKSVGSGRNINVTAITDKFKNKYIAALFMTINASIDTIDKDNFNYPEYPDQVAINNISGNVWSLLGVVNSLSAISSGYQQLKDIPVTIIKEINVTGAPAAGPSAEPADDTAPTFTSGDTAIANDGTNFPGQVVYTATVDDSADDSAGVTFSLASDASLAFAVSSAFSIDEFTGEVTIVENSNLLESLTQFSFTVIATDGAGEIAEQSVSGDITSWTY